MDEYIKREKLELAVNTLLFLNRRNFTIEDIETIIKLIPAADVVEIRHGEWIYEGEDDILIHLYCSNCRHRFKFGKIKKAAKSYCPNCGAKMDEKSDSDA